MIPAPRSAALKLALLIFIAGTVVSCRKQAEPTAVTGTATNSSPATATGAASSEVQLAARLGSQLVDLRTRQLFSDFRFSDQWRQSGVQFVHRVVDDAGKHYKPVHYDHGNGLAVADVDADGRLDLYFCNQRGGNQLWRNLGSGRFENITAFAGVGVDEKVSVAASFGDIDNDGDPDLFVTTVKMGNVLFENLGHGKFRDISSEAGLAYVGHSSGAVFFDYDRDGLLDLFLVNVGVYTSDTRGDGGYFVGFKDAFSGHLKPERAEASILYRNEGGRKFRNVSTETGLTDLSWSGDASVCDVNADGLPDLYLVNMQGDDHFYQNVDGKRFEDKTSAFFPKTSWGAMGLKFFDFNQDGLMDLFVTDMHSDMSDAQIKLSQSNLSTAFEKQKSEAWCTAQFSDSYLQGAANNIFGNSFYRNLGQGRFEEVSSQIGTETFWPWGPSAGDLNADGFEDLFVTAGMGFGFRYAFNSVLLNDAGQTFVDAEFALGVEPRAAGRSEKTAFTLDCSGLDVIHPLCRGRTGSVPVSESLSSRSSVILDLDDDGDLDIVTNEMNDRPQVLISNLAEKKNIHFLKVQLRGIRSNADAFGASVKVYAGGRLHYQFVDGKSGYLSQSSMPLYFGLGDAATVDKIEIRWPSGFEQAISRPTPSNQMLTIMEAQPRP